jgi:hypothetical protein
MILSAVVTPDMSTGVLFCSAVRISCGFGCGSCQNGLLSLLSSVRKARTCGSILGSVDGFGAATADCVVSAMPAIIVASFEVVFIAPSYGWTVTGPLRPAASHSRT